MALSSPLTPMVVPEPSWLQLAAEEKRALAELLAEEPGEAVGALEAADKVREEARKTKKKKETQQSVQEAEQAADRSEANLRKYRADETMKTLRKRAEKKADDTKKEEAAARKLKKQKERANHRQKQFRDTRRKVFIAPVYTQRRLRRFIDKGNEVGGPHVHVHHKQRPSPAPARTPRRCVLPRPVELKVCLSLGYDRFYTDALYMRQLLLACNIKVFIHFRPEYFDF